MLICHQIFFKKKKGKKEKKENTRLWTEKPVEENENSKEMQ